MSFYVSWNLYIFWSIIGAAFIRTKTFLLGYLSSSQPSHRKSYCPSPDFIYVSPGKGWKSCKPEYFLLLGQPLPACDLLFPSVGRCSQIHPGTHI